MEAAVPPAQAAAAAAADDYSNSNSNINPIAPIAFLRDPAAYLTSIASQPASSQTLSQLAGPVAAWFSSQSENEASVPPVAAAFLKAAGIQLRDASAQIGNAESEALKTKEYYEIITAAGVCASFCKNGRSVISTSGILPALAHVMLNSHTQTTSQLSHAAVEFLQCALLAEQYRYAARLIDTTWPRPDSTVSVKHVLRYYYLRGMIHVGCDDFVMAHRCFWTCLNIPAGVCSSIMIEAWKKLVLVQCILSDGKDPQSSKTILPKTTPNCMGRMLASQKDASASSKGKASSGKRPQSSAGVFLQPEAASHPSQQQQQLFGDWARGTVTERPSGEGNLTIICYGEIAQACYKREKTKLESLLIVHHMILQKDGNLGLVHQCHTQLMKNQVRHISQMYSVIPIPKAASLLGIDNEATNASDTENRVTALLVQSGVICEIQDDGMIVFSGEEAISASRTTSMVDLKEWMTLFERVQRLDVNILTSARYQSLAQKANSSRGNLKTAGAVGPRGVEDI